MTFWLRRRFTFEDRNRVLRKLEQVSFQFNNPQHGFEIFAALMISLASCCFPLELLDEPPKLQRQILLELLPKKLKTYQNPEISAKILVKLLVNFEFFEEREVALKCLAISIDRYPLILDSIPPNLLIELIG